MATVFLSHSSVDAEAAKIVAQFLRNAGLKVWLELDEITPGKLWLPALERALKDSTHFVVLVGENGVTRWVEREVRYALERNTEDPAYPIIPLLLPNAVERDIPLFLRQQQFLRLDWRQHDPDAIQKVTEAIIGAPPGHVSVLAPGESPFRGLLSFDTPDTLLFFGRDQEVDDLLDLLPNSHFLPVVGDSGSGKSSLVRAGLIPALLRGRMADQGAWVMDWRIAAMKPGDNAFEALAEAAAQWDPKLSASDRLSLIVKAGDLLNAGGIDGLKTILAALGLPSNSRQLLLIDQFEQLFTLGGSGRELNSTTRFLDTVLHASERPNSTLHVIATLRVDFFGLCYQHPLLWKLLTAHQYSLKRMPREHMREIIEKPMALAGFRPGPGLSDAMLADVSAQPGGLALLEHALDQLWKVSRGRQPTFADYEKIGGLKGAIQKHADEVVARKLKTDGQRTMARRIFVALTAVGEGTEDSARRIPKKALAGLPGGDMDEVLRILADERLVTIGEAQEKQPFDRDGAKFVSIAHETLIREWPDLRTWLNKHREDIRFQRQLDEAYESYKRDETQVLRGGRLEDAVRWVRKNRGELRQEVEAFIQYSVDEEKRRAWTNRAAIVGVVILASLAFWQWTRARGLLNETRIRQLAAESLALASTNADRSPVPALLAIESMRRKPLMENQDALGRSVRSMVVQVSRLASRPAVSSVAFSPNGKWVVTGSWDGSVRVMDASTGRPVSSRDRLRRVFTVAFSPDSQRVAEGGEDNSVSVLDAGTSKVLLQLPHSLPVVSIAYSSNGKWIATGSYDNVTRVFDAATGKEVSSVTHLRPVTSVVFSPDGNHLASASDDGSVFVIEAITGNRILRFVDGHAVAAAVFNPNGRLLATAGDDKTATVREIATGKEVTRVSHRDPVTSIAFSPDGERLATGSADGALGMTECASGQKLWSRAYQRRINVLAFSPDGKLVLFGSDDGTARMLDARTGKEVASLTHQRAVNSLAFSPDGRLAATASDDGTARIVEANTGKEIWRLTLDHLTNAVVFSPDEKYAATANEDGTARVIERSTDASWPSRDSQPNDVALSPDGRWVSATPTGKEVSRLTHQGPVTSVAFCPNGKWVATGSLDGTARLMEANTGREMWRLPHGGPVYGVSCSPDNRWVATASWDYTARVLESITGKEVARLTHEEAVYAVVFSPDGKRVASASRDHTARVMDVVTGKEVARLGHRDSVYAAAFSPDGKYIATGSDDKTARVMDVATGRELVRHVLGGPVRSVSFPDNGTLVTGALASGISVEISHIIVDPAELILDSCSNLSRNFTPEEWARYLPGEHCRATCPNLPDLCNVRK